MELPEMFKLVLDGMTVLWYITVLKHSDYLKIIRAYSPSGA